jgi:deoxyribodipyrimidine photo-lyase
MKFPKPYSNDKSAFPFSGGESEAWNRIESYFFKEKNLLQYKETRNGLIGTSYSSKLSPWLAQGCISPKSVYYNVKKLENEVGANDSTYWLIFELLWRDFFRFSMKKYGALYFLKGGIQNKNMDTYQNDPEKIDRWVQGKTGVDFVDANMKELSQTGFISNRGRQIVASYFCNDLKLDWRYGAAYFEAQLIDYDPCSNWGNWAYIAGVGNDNRNDRYFNIEKQQKTYDPHGEYCKIWL